jgi:hypothetical protein
MKSLIRVGNKTKRQNKRQKKTDIGHSPRTRFRSKRRKQHARLYRGEGKPIEIPQDGLIGPVGRRAAPRAKRAKPGQTGPNLG